MEAYKKFFKHHKTAVLDGITVTTVFSENNMHGPTEVNEIVQIPYRYLQYGSLMYLLPYDIERTSEGFKCSKRTGLKGFITVALCLSSDILMVKELWEQFQKSSEPASSGKDDTLPITGFVAQLVRAIWTLYYIAYRYLLWTRRSHFEGVLNSLAQLEKKMVTELKVTPPAPNVIKLATVFFVAYPFLEALWSVGPNIINGYVEVSQQNGVNDTMQIISAYGFKSLETSVDLFAMFGDSLALSMVLMHAWILKTLAKTFIGHLRERGEALLTAAEEEKVIEVCTDMLEYSEMLEEAVGFFVFTFCFALMPNYSYSLMQAFTMDWNRRLKMIMTSLTYIISLCTAADANLILKEFSSLLMMGPIDSSTCETKEELEEQMYKMEELRILLHRISTNGFGIKGHAFTITYGFVGNLAGLILTYAIIIIQFQESTG